MMPTTGGNPSPSIDAKAIPHDDVYDILRGLAALTDSKLVSAIAETVARHPATPLANALNHKQVASKSWLIRELSAAGGVPAQHVLVVGGWLGVLAALLLDRVPEQVLRVTTLDIDPSCRPVAETLNCQALAAGRFRAVTADMTKTPLADLAGPWPPIDLVVNTSFEHLAEPRRWLDRLPRGMRVVIQSNDYVREPDHVSCVPNLAEFKAQAALAVVEREGALPLKNYTRFTLIGRV
jgi:hypothetical protein